jgi:hypothetical protein
MTSGRPIEVGSPYHELIKPISRWAKLGLVGEIISTYIRVRVLLWRRDLPSVVDSLRGPSAVANDLRAQAIGARLGHAVDRTLALVPFDSRCLVRSLVLTRMLGRRGIASTLVIGVAVDPAFSAHAWVESGGRPLLPSLDTSRLVEL